MRAAGGRARSGSDARRRRSAKLKREETDMTELQREETRSGGVRRRQSLVALQYVRAAAKRGTCVLLACSVSITLRICEIHLNLTLYTVVHTVG